ncbi:subtilisin-like protease SBT4.6 [Impatiens glandulifera]|uniref:subtilisin-like protease SBT4.6 n=1 Tax=Impatiens glandulifera TaxID=253017 RepID=UPI001FB09B7B|nr:subtilisin-like protease SBT4.6 [Impatiens glandulifera]
MVERTLVRSYTRSFNGFAANLTLKEVSKLKSVDEVISVFKSYKFHTQTTRSWDYMGLSLDIPRNPTVESDVIIGHFDKGILPESHSFSDYGLSPIPKKWKGVCLGGKNFTCNRKLIGARFYSNSKDAMDREGHGTHTASIAAGRILKNVSFFGIANGTARGGVPSARIATYKVCDFFCDGYDILSGFDDAIADNVDIITISINIEVLTKISDDVIAIGSFHAIEKNILTVNAAGNFGNVGLGLTTSIAPWVFTVAASKERNIFNKLVLGNGHTLLSRAVNAFHMSSHNTGLVDGRRATRQCNKTIAIQCTAECLDPSLVKGKIILCDADYLNTDVLSNVADAGATGVIFRARGESNELSVIVPLPTAILNDHDFQYIQSYLKSKMLHSAQIVKTDIVEYHAPTVPSFSSKGPNTILPEIFKPDITAPGVDILAAYPPYVYVVKPVRNFGRLVTKYSFDSGTSMSCPHVVGAAAYVKSKHFDWSASAIKSSLMTTARTMNGNHNLDVEHGYGAGHIDPIKAAYPGLVYETFMDDYFEMFCSFSEGDNWRKILKSKKKCPKTIRKLPKDLNYPAMTSPVNLQAQGVLKVVMLDEHNDIMALASFYQALHDDVLLMVAEKDSAKLAWKTLKRMHVGVERVKEAKVKTL